MVKPIKPQKIYKKRLETFPDVMIEAVNRLIAQEWDGFSATITQDEIINLFLSLSPSTVDEDEIFDNHWLDFEPIFEKAGWKVTYDQPGYCETYDASYTFLKKKKKKKSSYQGVSH